MINNLHEEVKGLERERGDLLLNTKVEAWGAELTPKA